MCVDQRLIIGIKSLTIIFLPGGSRATAVVGGAKQTTNLKSTSIEETKTEICVPAARVRSMVRIAAGLTTAGARRAAPGGAAAAAAGPPAAYDCEL